MRSRARSRRDSRAVVLAASRRVFSAGAEGVIRQHAIADRKKVREFAGQGEAVYALAFHAPTKKLASGSYDGIVNIWNAEVRNAAQHADMKERFAAEGLEGVDAPPEHFREVVARDIAKWNKVVAVANIPRVQ